MKYKSSIDGVSAVNPQARGDYSDYINAAFNNAKQRLDPILGQQRQSYEQSMVNRGLPVGGESYNKAFQQLDQNQNDAYSNAAFDAMGFGLDAQAQDFGQDATRSSLANAMLTAQMNNDTNRYGLDINKDLGYAQLDEGARQFDASLGQRGYEFDSGLVSDIYKFDSGMDYNYWNQGNQLDYMYDRANQDDYRWAYGQDRQDYYDSRQEDWYDDSLMMQLLGMGQGPGVYTQDPTSAYNTQMGGMFNQGNFQNDMIGRLFGF